MLFGRQVEDGREEEGLRCQRQTLPQGGRNDRDQSDGERLTQVTKLGALRIEKAAEGGDRI